ncbi:MAG TPA: spermidine/putrescine ABC transporter substrate-binding protein [Gammaproteobacteria bacterium]|jgi:spermidine/putrescine transport system substrate-binding protein|nr:spermidine/putrescine ABC transporter substrate-binding protein [Gammaproteobacteria bacterium]
MKRWLCVMGMFLFPLSVFAKDQVLNIYAWPEYIPDFVIYQFEKETGIKINLSTYQNNESMYVKVRAVGKNSYDLLIPSSYLVDRMRQQDMLEKLDKNKLPGIVNLNRKFLFPAYDPTSEYSIPFLWGVTGIFVNTQDEALKTVTRWRDLWDKRFLNQLVLLDDSREIFSMTLISLGYPANDTNPAHIKAAFLKLRDLMQNVKVFSSDTIVSIMIDGDATVGVAWNGDTFKASEENKNVHFVFPQEGFVIWVDNFVMLKNAPHKEAAYQFLNFILRPDIAKAISLYTKYPTANLAGQKLLPDNIRNNPTVYPSDAVLKRGHFQQDISSDALALYEKYWEAIKMGA